MEMVEPSYFYVQTRWDEHMKGLEKEKEEETYRLRRFPLTPGFFNEPTPQLDVLDYTKINATKISLMVLFSPSCSKPSSYNFVGLPAKYMIQHSECLSCSIRPR
jgi:hypothetical protein